MEVSNPEVVQDDMVVLLDYTLFVEGEETDSGPIQYLHGHGNIIPGLENALKGMKIGESKDVTVVAVDAYGDYDESNVIKIDRKSFPADFDIKLGEPMRIRDESGHIFTGTIIALDEVNVEFDMNHALAGKDLFFKTTIMDLRPATPEEISHGHIQSACSGCDTSSCSDGCCG